MITFFIFFNFLFDGYFRFEGDTSKLRVESNTLKRRNEILLEYPVKDSILITNLKSFNPYLKDTVSQKINIERTFKKDK